MKWALGLMSGTSLDGIDVALVKTDGVTVSEYGAFATYPYDAAFKDQIRNAFGRPEASAAVQEAVTDRHIQAVQRFIQTEGIDKDQIDVVGFHGQTLFHDPAAGLTVQAGEGQRMADALGLDVVYDFRTADVAAGGQGAPLVPVFHAAIVADLPKPLAVLNLGGVGNVTWIGEDGDFLAFDTGPANALIDDWVQQHSDQAWDFQGALARAGMIDDDAVNSFIRHPYFQQPPPKSLDRDAFAQVAAPLVADLSCEDGAATLTAFTVASIMVSQGHFPRDVAMWIVCGGGRLNPAIMSGLKAFLPVPTLVSEDVGWQGDALEAQAFAYLAARTMAGLPLTYPTTTGVGAPKTGGRLCRPA